jgi:hypothetical protein
VKIKALQLEIAIIVFAPSSLNCYTIKFKMKVAPTILLLIFASSIATPSQRDEKYSLRWASPPDRVSYRLDLKFELDADVEGMDKSFGITGNVGATRIKSYPDGSYTMRFRTKMSEMNKELAPDAKESVYEATYDKQGNEINRKEIDRTPNSHLSSFMAFDPPTSKVAIGEVWTVNTSATPPDETTASFGAAQLAGIEMVGGTKCYRVEQVFRGAASDAKPSLSTVWVRVSDGVVFKMQWSGTFLQLNVQGATVTSKATLKLLEG